MADEEICVKFNLKDLLNGDLKSFLEGIEDLEKVCVISVIGKTSLNSPNFKEHTIADALGKHIFENETKKENAPSSSVRGCYDMKSRSLFLQMTGISDTTQLVRSCEEMEHQLKLKNFLEVWSDLHFDFVKLLLLLFCISHIVIVVHPVSTFDISYVYLFRALDAIRAKCFVWFREILGGVVHVSPEWIQNARPCSPRVLFVFESCQLFPSSDSTTLRHTHKKQSPLKKLEHSLEDQIYRILRKSRVITNVSGNSLFAVPANQEFVYIFPSKPYVTDFVGFVLNQIQSHCQMAREQDSRQKLQQCDSFGGIYENGSHLEGGSLGHHDPSEHSFSKFLFDHIHLALTKGFDDNVGRYPVPAYFELVSTHAWFEVLHRLGSTLFAEAKDSKSKAFAQNVRSATDTDLKFSEGRCAKVLPLASAAYQDNLPTHYTHEYHQTRLAHALQVFGVNARGPAVQRFAQQLKWDCERLWKSGHQMCEVLSLTGNHCMNPLHRTEAEKEEEKAEGGESLPVMSHCSQVKIVSTCDCGRRQATREDPFDVKAANHGFYVAQRHQCCRDLERIDFPVFRATLEGRPEEEEDPPLPSPTTDPPEDTLDFSSQGNSDENSLVNEMDHQLTSEEHSQGEGAEEERHEIVIRIEEERDKVLTRQASTTECLPGMLHSESRPALLPTFSSWSLVCLGPSSLYSHNIGLQDQPGFIPGTNYLLPWDVTVKLEQKERWPALWEGKRPLSLKAKKAIREGPQFNVKIFIGVEYECCRGHRFMCSSPDRVLRVTHSGHVKENASKVTGSDMPLYFPCPCRSSKAQVAQLMRIHVVTPKAPVHVTLRPRVQPAPDPCPAFFPTHNQPLKLSQSAYWVLRLPFVYEGDGEPFLPPREAHTSTASRLMKGTYNIAEQQQQCSGGGTR